MALNNSEVWMPVVGFEGQYEVSNRGRVRSLDRVITPASCKMNPLGMSQLRRGKMLRPGLSSNGYLTVSLGGKSFPVQHLVAAAFIGPRPGGLLVLHNDGVKANNWDSNLRYGTHAENQEDSRKHGTRAMGSRHPMSKLDELTASMIAALKGRWPQSELAMLFDVSPSAVQAVHDGRSWKHSASVSQDRALEWFFSFGPAGDYPRASHSAREPR